MSESRRETEVPRKCTLTNLSRGNKKNHTVNAYYSLIAFLQKTMLKVAYQNTKRRLKATLKKERVASTGGQEC